MAYLAKYVSSGSRMIALCQRGYSSAVSPFVFSEEIRHAKSKALPIVALESTIITHGMPYPQNLETAKQVENIIRDRGAIPATVAILKGQLTVGLSDEQLSYLAQAQGVVKASRRDLAPIMAAQLDGATTVAGTIIAAKLADIPVFVTGGIGGVHRHGEKTLDISADLNELGRSDTLVVCSGVKSILDIGRTLEYLETQGVCVCAFGDSSEFPAFYTRRSGHRAPHRVADAAQAARLLHAARTLRLSSGTVVAVPIPEKYAMDEKIIEEAISGALQEAENKGIFGKEVTPFILSAVANATSGASLNANIALIKNNAKVGADIAVEFKKLKNVDNLENAFNIGSAKGVGKCTGGSVRHFHSSSRSRAGARCGDDDGPLFSGDKNAEGDVLVIGGANVDRTYRLKEDRVQLDGSTHPCGTEQCGGGVARNMAEALWRLRGGRTRLLTALGDDADGKYLDGIAPGLLLDGCEVKNARTPSYAAVLDARGECLLGLGDMVLHNHISPEMVNKHIDVLNQAPLVILDGNLPQPTIDFVLDKCHQLQKPVFFEPTDRRKAIKIIRDKYSISYASPNLSELRAMAQYLDLSKTAAIKNIGDLNEILELSSIVAAVIKFIVITMGSKGVMTVNNTENKFVQRFYPTVAISKIENVSGAGDCFASGFIHGMLLGFSEPQCISVGYEAAKMALLSKNTVPNDFGVTLSSLVKVNYDKLN
ncbi:pseudouridine-metabolizing bifunctional protein C1861.05 [Trichoplusia ni]|uniref:Pseudouridine-metabolizing bifunctional protein C1861.05 n=1 Tax=Trichoplusia ni TaxID=7111 RepID=A0A7E5VGC5_TRINI|nr:pseudouridine-metabolizing bifunctional protein C1861.05 [Trichoplusia ni]XP_026727341.1 pseudouridine-metabolizing bifunctional protein C1861.05 [Trichoplusia ni]